jgi:hypothetical protein
MLYSITNYKKQGESMFQSRKIVISILSVLSVSFGSAHAGVIVSAQSASVDGGVGGTSVGESFNQSGLSAGYTSGVTDFDTYIASNPTHSQDAGTEFILSQTSVSVVYDLGSSMSIDALALWNEDAFGFGTGELSWSLNGIDFFALTTINPVDNPAFLTYGAEVFSLAETFLRYIRFDISGCPQPDGLASLACGIGEVAFRVADGDVSEVPIPGAIPLFLAGLAGLQLRTRRQRKS